MQKRKCYLASQVLFIPVTVFGDEDPEEVEEAVILGWHGSGSNALEVKLLDCGSRFWFPLEHVMFWLGFDGYPKPPDAQVQRQSSSSDDGLTGNSRPRKRQRTMLVKKERRTYRTLASKFQQV